LRKIAEILIQAVGLVMERLTSHQTTKTIPIPIQSLSPVHRLGLIREREIQSCHTPATNSSGWMIWKFGDRRHSWV
jgi:hypothetical protein